MKNPVSLFPQRSRFGMPSIVKTMADMENEMDRLMQSSWRLPDEIDAAGFTPTCSITENDKEYIAQFDIPGVKKGDVKIEMLNNRLTVSGERKEKNEEKDARRYLSESYYGSFMRSFTLPNEVDDNKVDAHYEDGVLIIKVPKLATTKAKEVKIQ